MARNVRHTGAAKKRVSAIHLPSLVTRSRRPEDSRKEWAKWIMYNTDRTKAFKLHAVIMCKFVCIVVTPLPKRTKQGKKRTATRNAQPLLVPTEELREMQGRFIKKTFHEHACIRKATFPRVFRQMGVYTCSASLSHTEIEALTYGAREIVQRFTRLHSRNGQHKKARYAIDPRVTNRLRWDTAGTDRELMAKKHKDTRTSTCKNKD